MGKLISDYEKRQLKVYDESNCYLNVVEDLSEIKKVFLDKVEKNARILELGAGGGHFSGWLSKNGYNNVIVSDLSKIALQKIVGRYPKLKQSKIDAQGFIYSKKFDVILSLDVIEHLPNVQAHLKSVNKSLNSGGIYVIKTPNKIWEIMYYKHYLLRGDKNKEHPWWTHHISLMTKQELNEELNSNGFRKVEFLRQKRLTKAQENKLKTIFPETIALIVGKFINLFLPILPISLGFQLIAVAQNS